MRPPRSQPAIEAHSAELADWRRRRLVAAGVPPQLAADLAGSGEIDLHELLGLIDRGCPPELAARILAPLEEERRPP